MWDKLLSLFKERPLEEEIHSEVPRVGVPVEEMPSDIINPDGPSTHIGFNYLKGMNDEENDIVRSRRFTNLNRLLRGDYDGQVAGFDEKPKANVRREDS